MTTIRATNRPSSSKPEASGSAGRASHAGASDKVQPQGAALPDAIRPALASGKLGEPLLGADTYTQRPTLPGPSQSSRRSGSAKVDKDRFLQGHKAARATSPGPESARQSPASGASTRPAETSGPKPQRHEGQGQAGKPSAFDPCGAEVQDSPILVEPDFTPPPEQGKSGGRLNPFGPPPKPKKPEAQQSSGGEPATAGPAPGTKTSGSGGTKASGAAGSSAEAAHAQAKEGLGSFLEGAVAGDLSGNESWSAVAGQSLMGLVPVLGQLADARDIAAAVKDLIQGKDGALTDLGLSLLGVVPGLDFLKSARRLGAPALEQAAQTIAQHLDKSGFLAAAKRIREWHDKRATQIFGPGKGQSVTVGKNRRHYDKYYKGRDVEFKSDNFTKAPRAPDRLAAMEKQIDRDISFKKLGLANPHWHFNHDPIVAPEMRTLLKKLDDAGVPWTHGDKPGF